MAVLLQITYQKKLGLPNFSSHSCSVSVQVEVADLSHVAEENNRLYKLLQASVDEEIQKVGFMPDATSYGMDGGQTNGTVMVSTSASNRRAMPVSARSNSIWSPASSVTITPARRRWRTWPWKCLAVG